MYSTIPIHWNLKSAPASPGTSRAGPALYVFSLLGPIFRGGVLCLLCCTVLRRGAPKGGGVVLPSQSSIQKAGGVYSIHNAIFLVGEGEGREGGYSLLSAMFWE
jgi:hypothetical protein